MKNDYLWDKTGDDAEIERLENALASLRYRAAPTSEAAGSLQPQTAAARAAKPARSFSVSRGFLSFKFAVGASACAAFLLIVLGVWMRGASEKINFADKSAAVVAPVNNALSPIKTNVENSIDSPIKNIAEDEKSTERKIAARKIAGRRQTVAASFRRREIKATPLKNAPAKIKFSDEELYAYDQLKRALSIVSSNLKLVKDKAESAETNDAEPEDGR